MKKKSSKAYKRNIMTLNFDFVSVFINCITHQVRKTSSSRKLFKCQREISHDYSYKQI